eukprot:6375614-Heterocapsa_arctica.AAC.1
MLPVGPFAVASAFWLLPGPKYLARPPVESLSRLTLLTSCSTFDCVEGLALLPSLLGLAVYLSGLVPCDTASPSDP